MKKKSVNLTLILVLFISTIVIANYRPIKALIKPDKCDLKLGVISDTHITRTGNIQSEKLKKALNMLNNMSENNLDALVIAGDLTDTGELECYKKFNDIIKSSLNNNVQKVFTMGNHEFYNGLSAEGSKQRFMKETGEKINQRKVIKGYSFITVNTENACLGGSFGKDTKEWLSKQLEISKNEDSKKPIFVIVHQPVKGTVYGSNDSSDSLYSVLKNYPQVVCFAGHSHYPINDERCIDQKDFTVVNTGNLKKVDFEKDKDIINYKEALSKDISQGLYVEVQGNNVYITRLDFLNNRIIKDKWIIQNPSDKTKYKYTNARKLNRSCPHFGKNSSCKVMEVNNNGCKVKFSKAYHEDFVHSYKIKVTNMDTGIKEGEFRIISDFYVLNQSEDFKVKLANLKRNTKYSVEIRAIESFGNESDNSLKCEFKTST